MNAEYISQLEEKIESLSENSNIQHYKSLLEIIELDPFLFSCEEIEYFVSKENKPIGFIENLSFEESVFKKHEKIIKETMMTVDIELHSEEGWIHGSVNDTNRNKEDDTADSIMLRDYLILPYLKHLIKHGKI